jgi:hypothetical protein
MSPKKTDNAAELRAAIYCAFKSSFESQCEYDNAGYTANVVDGLFAIARSISRLAEALEEKNKPTEIKPKRDVRARETFNERLLGSSC